MLGRDIEDADGALGAWLDDLGARAALIRPDRYLFGAAPVADDLPDLIDQLNDKLHLIAAPAVRDRLMSLAHFSLNHLGIFVIDIEKMTKFYTSFFGFVVLDEQARSQLIHAS